MGSPPVEDPRALEERLGHIFADRALLERSLTHPSALPPGAVRAGEQLEFLGDAVLNLVVADLLLHHFPELAEGELSKRRATLVRTVTLATKARELGLDGALRLGRGEDRSGGRSKASILAHAYEAVLGAVFRDAGFAAAHRVVERHFADDIARGGVAGAPDWKTILQERTQAAGGTVPQYRVAEESGPAHARRFTVEVWIEGAHRATGHGSSKRSAEQEAARAALDALERKPG
ncbi:MAG: ribonuclease III [Candidatus Binatia bacterium]